MSERTAVTSRLALEQETLRKFQDIRAGTLGAGQGRRLPGGMLRFDDVLNALVEMTLEDGETLHELGKRILANHKRQG